MSESRRLEYQPARQQKVFYAWILSVFARPIVTSQGLVVLRFAIRPGVGTGFANSAGLVLPPARGLSQSSTAAIACAVARSLPISNQPRAHELRPAHKGGYPRGRARLAASRIHRVQQLRAAGKPYRQIARLMGVSAKAIRKLLRRSGWKESRPKQLELALNSVQPEDPNLSAFSAKSKEASPTSHDTDPMDRGADRLLARLALLEDVPPLFGSAVAVRHSFDGPSLRDELACLLQLAKEPLALETVPAKVLGGRDV